MQYSKAHLSFADQLELVRSRGLGCDDEERAIAALRAVGYYRLSAYTYPMRKLLDPDAPRETSVQHRSAEFMDGHTIDQAIDLYLFDKRLRMVTIEGIESFEVGMRVGVSHALGRRDAFGHLDTKHLRASVCGRPLKSGATRHEEWVERLNRQVAESSSEDFVRHFQEKYGGSLPIWVATEVMNFGQLVRLYKLMDNRDRNGVSRGFGIKTGRTLDPVSLNLSHVRNTSAHHSRLWNRRFTYSLPEFRPAEVGEDLQHLADVNGDVDRRKLYTHAAYLGYMLREMDPETGWPAKFATVVKKFPAIKGLSPESDMGFPHGWASLPVWRHK